jgi:hypothetical protein
MNPTFEIRDTAYAFTPLGGPIDKDPNAPVFAWIGHAIAAQARLEHLVTSLVMHVNKRDASEALHDPDPRHQYKALLKLLRKWLRNHPAYAKHKLFDDDQFYQGLLKDADLRNEFAHGFLEHVDADTGNFTMCILEKHGADEWTARKVIFAPMMPRMLSTQASLATRHFVEVAKMIFEQS